MEYDKCEALEKHIGMLVDLVKAKYGNNPIAQNFFNVLKLSADIRTCCESDLCNTTRKKSTTDTDEATESNRDEL